MYPTKIYKKVITAHAVKSTVGWPFLNNNERKIKKQDRGPHSQFEEPLLPYTLIVMTFLYMVRAQSWKQ